MALPYLGVGLLGLCRWTGCLFEVPALAQGVFFVLPELAQGAFLSFQRDLPCILLISGTNQSNSITIF